MNKTLSYEQAMKRLEEITVLMENGAISLDESIKLFEEGTKLSALCNDYLDKAEQKITQLIKDE